MAFSRYLLLALVLVALGLSVESRLVYGSMSPSSGIYTRYCSGGSTGIAGTGYFRESVRCCYCSSTTYCYGCTSSSDTCQGSTFSCTNGTKLALGIIIAIVIIPIVIVAVVTIVIIVCCCCAAAAAASNSNKGVSGQTVIVTQPAHAQPVYVEETVTYSNPQPTYVQTNQTVEMQQVSNPYGQPTYVQQQPAGTYTY